jgi:hypothetical protein
VCTQMLTWPTINPICGKYTDHIMISNGYRTSIMSCICKKYRIAKQNGSNLEFSIKNIYDDCFPGGGTYEAFLTDIQSLEHQDGEDRLIEIIGENLILTEKGSEFCKEHINQG